MALGSWVIPSAAFLTWFIVRKICDIDLDSDQARDRSIQIRLLIAISSGCTVPVIVKLRAADAVASKPGHNEVVQGGTNTVRDRISSGKALAKALEAWRQVPALLALALPRGSVPVAYEVAAALGAELDLLLVRKLGTPGNPELAMGAIAAGGCRVINTEIVEALALSSDAIEAVAAREGLELARCARAYRGNRPLPTIAGRTLILIDDGIATGATMRAAIAALRVQRPGRIVVAVPIAPIETIANLRLEAEEVVRLTMPEPFGAIGRFYDDFAQVSDDEVRVLLARAWQMPHTGSARRRQDACRARHRRRTPRSSRVL